MKRIYLVRHAESYSNAGIPTESPVTNPITNQGRNDAVRFAQTWWADHAPDLIVTSPFLRTKMTADPMRIRYPHVPHEEWRVEEFTPLAHSKYKGTTHEGREPEVARYWARNDPDYVDGEGAESLRVNLFGRVWDFVRICERRLPEETILVFTHGQFMKAVLWRVLFGTSTVSTPSVMAQFYHFSQAIQIPNLAVLELNFNGQWSIPGAQAIVGA